MSLRFDYKMFLNVLLYALKKTFEGQWPEYNWSKYSGAMERPIKVNRHKGGGVDIYFRREAWVQIPSEPNFSQFSFLLLVKLRLTCEDHASFWFYIGSSKEINFCLQIHSLNFRKEENLCLDTMLSVNDSSVINKISLFDLNMCSQSGRDEVGMFILGIHCMKKSPNWLFFHNNRLR